jgi:hypothetical protein
MLKRILFILVILAFLLVSCSGASMPAKEAQVFSVDDSAYGEAEYVEPVEPGFYDERATSLTVANTTTQTSIERMVIKNADIAIITADPAQSMADISKMAENMGGFVVESNLYQQTLSSGLQVPYASITIRVPAEKLDQALSQIKDGAIEVENENISGQDVTSQYTDLQSQLRNLEAAEAQLQEIMEEATKTEDVLNIFNQLVSVREQIEVIKGQMQYYEQATALSKISVSITADEAVQPIQVGGWQPSGVAKDAIEALIEALQFIATAAIWIALCVLPIGLLIGLPLFFVVRSVIRIRRRRKSGGDILESQPEEETSEKAE